MQCDVFRFRFRFSPYSPQWAEGDRTKLTKCKPWHNLGTSNSRDHQLVQRKMSRPCWTHSCCLAVMSLSRQNYRRDWHHQPSLPPVSNVTSYFTFTSAVLGHHTSKIAELCDWLQFFTVDHYSQLSALPPWHSHNFGLFHIYSHVVFLYRLLECIHYALKSTLGMRDHSLVVCKTEVLYSAMLYFVRSETPNFISA